MNTIQENILEQLLVNVGDMALKRRARKLIQGLNPTDGERILDVGCGDAFFLHLLSNLKINLKLYGSDIDIKALSSAQKNLKGKKIIFKEADLMKKLPFDDDFFDKVIMAEVAEHLPNDVKGLKEINRVLKKGGLLSLSVPNKNYPLLWDPPNWILERTQKKHIKSGFWAGIWNQHVRLYSPEQIKKVAEKAGFDVIICEPITWWSLPFNHHLINLAARALYREGTPPEVISALSKYDAPKKRSPYVDILFGIINANDRINDYIRTKKVGQGVYVLARKK